MKVNIYGKEEIADELLDFSVIFAKLNDEFLFVRHKKRDTYEVAGGHREIEEDIDDCARRELFEETGATEFEIYPICAYGVEKEGNENYGMLYFAEIFEIDMIPEISEMAEVIYSKNLPEKLTYPQIAPKLMESVNAYLKNRD